MCFLFFLSCVAAVQQRNWEGVLELGSPAAAFPERLYIDMNTLDAPDVSFYAGGVIGAALNVSAVAIALSPLVALAPTLAVKGFTGCVIQVTGIEDFISYDALGNGSEVYPTGSVHRANADAWTAALEPALSAIAATGLHPILMAFDLQYPPILAAKYNLTLYSPELRVVLFARFKELFARLPALHSVLLYVADCWTPRAGYAFAQLWSTVEELAVAATLYYETFTAAAPQGSRLIFSLWVPPSKNAIPVADTWALLRNSTPFGITFAVHDSEGDFSVASPINALLEAGAARDRALFVGSDAFRQLDGWGRLIAAPADEWAAHLRVAANTGAVGGMVYNDWSPAITWPDSGSSLQNFSAGAPAVSWRSWPRFRSFGLRALGLFSPAEAAVAVLAGLHAAPATADPWALLGSWAEGVPLCLKPTAAALLARAFSAAQPGWAAKYLPGVDRYAIEWNSVFTPKDAPNAESAGEGLSSLYANATLASIDAANAAVDAAFAKALSLVEAALAANNSLKHPKLLLSNAAVAAEDPPDAGAALLLAAQKTRATGALFCGFRVAVWLNNSLSSGAAPLATACARLAVTLPDLRSRLSSYAELYPEEGTRWNLVAADPALDARPVFFRSQPRSLSDWLPLFEKQVQTACVGGAWLEA